MLLDDLRDPVASVVGPAGRGTEHPRDLPAGFLERHLVGVERAGQADVVQHRRDVEQLAVETPGPARRA